MWGFCVGKKHRKIRGDRAAGFITLMAFVFNTCVAGIPTPLSDTGIFMNSLCGMWVLVAVVQGISLLIQAVLQPTVEQETGASETNVWNRLQKVGGQLKPKATNSQEIILMLLRLATVLLAIVSWWSTAQGMRDYVFSQAWQANLASFAIQSILLGLTLSCRPSGAGYIVCAENLRAGAQRRGLVLLLVVQLCFIVGTVYEKSWQTESRLLVQSVYRNELYKADEFVQISSDACGNAGRRGGGSVHCQQDRRYRNNTESFRLGSDSGQGKLRR